MRIWYLCVVYNVQYIGATKSRRGTGNRRRRHSGNFDASEMMKRIEESYQSDNGQFKDDPHSIYSRLAANVYKYQYLHKVRWVIHG